MKKIGDQLLDEFIIKFVEYRMCTKHGTEESAMKLNCAHDALSKLRIYIQSNEK